MRGCVALWPMSLAILDKWWIHGEMRNEPWMANDEELALVKAALCRAEKRARLEKRSVALMSDLMVSTLNWLPYNKKVVEVVRYPYYE
jgi:hypothetical protein